MATMSGRALSEAISGLIGQRSVSGLIHAVTEKLPATAAAGTAG
jgi:hypothetical protein